MLVEVYFRRFFIVVGCVRREGGRGEIFERGKKSFRFSLGDSGLISTCLFL